MALTPAASTQKPAEGRQWLLSEQARDGRWRGARPDRDVRVTSLVVLATLANHAAEDARVGAAMERGLDWLVAQQADNGSLVRRSVAGHLEDHALATLALTHASLLRPAARWRAPTQRAIDYLEGHGDPMRPGFTAPLAAWRALLREALRTAPALNGRERVTFERPVERDAHLRIWLDRQRDARANGRATDPLARSAELVCRICLVHSPEEDDQIGELARALVALPLDPATADPRHMLFVTEATYRLGGAPWKLWSKQLRAIVRAQRKDGELRQTLDPPANPWGQQTGRMGHTCLAMLVLAQLYRYSTLVR